MQEFESMRLIEIILCKYNKDGNNPKMSNYLLREGNAMPAIFAQLLRCKLCEIYRWMTSISPAYLNNRDDYDNMINRWAT